MQRPGHGRDRPRRGRGALNNPRWQLYAWGRLADWLAGEAIDAGHYVVVLVADDPAETDGDPLVDGPGPGFGVLLLRAEAFGPGGTHAVVEQTLARVSADELSRRPDLVRFAWCRGAQADESQCSRCLTDPEGLNYDRLGTDNTQRHAPPHNGRCHRVSLFVGVAPVSGAGAGRPRQEGGGIAQDRQEGHEGLYQRRCRQRAGGTATSPADKSKPAPRRRRQPDRPPRRPRRMPGRTQTPRKIRPSGPRS